MRMLLAFFTTCLAIARAAPPPDENTSPHRLKLPPSMIDDKIREKILKPCDDPILDTIEYEPERVWDELGCYHLHGALDWAWYSNLTAQKNTSYVEFVSDRMHGPENMRCHQIDNGVCNTPNIQCHDTDFACGYLLLNSFANIHKMYHRGYVAVQAAHDRVQDDVLSFVDRFAPQLEVFDALGDVLIPIITLGLFGIGSFAKKAIETAKKSMADNAKKKWEQRFPHIENGIALSAGMAMPYGLIHLPAQESGEATDAFVYSMLGMVYDHFVDLQMNHTRDLFSGSAQSLQALWRMVDRGAFMRYDGNANLGEYINEVKKMFFAALIPKTWEIAPKFRDENDHKYSTPIFLATGNDCGSEWDDIMERYAGDKEDFPEICYEGKQWHIVVAHLRRDSGYLDHSRIQKWLPGFVSVPGVEILTSDEGYKGVHAVDMLASAYSGYKKGGEKQFWAPDVNTELSKVVTKDGSGYVVHYTEGVRGPGLVQMQVCPDLEKTIDNLVKASNDIKLADEREWPCGI